MQQITKQEFKSDNFRYREWYQGCGSKLEAEGTFTVEDKLAGLEATQAWIAEPKRDGIWAIAFFDEHGVRFFSRTCERKPYSLDKVNVPALYGCALIGELGYGSQESIRRRNMYGFDFMDVYDVGVFDYKVCTDMYDQDRRDVMDVLMSRLQHTDMATHPGAHHFLATPRFTGQFLQRYAAEPEGLILKPRDAGFVYQPGTKAKHWMKVKKDHTVDMVIMGYETSTATTKVGKGMIEHLTCGMYVNGELKALTKVGGMPHAMQVDIAADWKRYLGTVIELKHFGQFKSGALRHPSVVRLRDDKKARDCIFDTDALSVKSFKNVAHGDQDAARLE